MESKDFIIHNLKELYSSLPYLEIKYEFRDDIYTHVIEVKPIHCYDKDRSYIIKQIAFEEEFEQIFPNEEILFMTENVLIQIENPILELGNSNSKRHYVEQSQIATQSEKVDFSIMQIFSYMSKVNLSYEPFYYITCKQSSDDILRTEEVYKVELPDIICVQEKSALEYKVPKDEKNNTKKALNQSESFFFINIAS